MIDVQHARIITSDKNVQLKLQKAIAAIWFNTISREKNLTPKCIHTKVNGNNVQNRNTKLAAMKYRLYQEIKFLYKKKQNLKEQLYKLHLECAKYN